MALVYINPNKEGMHPLRHTLGDERMAEILQGAERQEDWMTVEELEAATDYLFDFVAAKIQTHLGEVTLQ